jgi:hypothetical protein
LIVPTTLLLATLLSFGGDAFTWKENAHGELDLHQGDRRMLRYMHAFDDSTEERRHDTYKVYHHVFDADGKLLTKGPGGLYTHHRGIFIGWNKTSYGDKTRDFWHMKEVTQQHVEVLAKEADEDGATLQTRIHWVDDAGVVVIDERRTITVHASDHLLKLDFHTVLTSKVGDVRLDGDPEHAGVQYRPHNGVAEGDASVKAKYLFHEDGIDPKKDHDLPWAASSYGLHGKRYWVQHLNHPDNPDGTIYSAYRDYGRFGAFPAVDLDADDALELHYRIIVGEGELPERSACRTSYEAYTAEAQPR